MRGDRTTSRTARTRSPRRLHLATALTFVIAALVGGAALPAMTYADPVIAAAGDIACDPASAAAFNNGLGDATHCHQKYTSDLLIDPTTGALRPELSAVLALGDVQYEDGRYFRYVACPPAACTGFATPPVPASYDAKDPAGNPISWSRANPIVRPSLGNHEYGASSANFDPNAGGYFTYFGAGGVDQVDVLSGLGASAGDPRRGYYSFDVPTGCDSNAVPGCSSSWHVVALNSECAAGLAAQVGWDGGCDPGSPEEAWLRADLAANPRDCTLAYWHHPLFSSGGIGNSVAMQPIWQDLYDTYADVVLNGHDHNYERFAPQDPNGRTAAGRGIREFVVGTGGKSLLAVGTLKSNSEVLDNTTWGILELTLHGASSAHPNGWYEWRFRPDGRSGTLADSGQADCVKPQPAPGPSPSFTLSAAPANLTVVRGSPASYKVTIAGTNGFNGQVSLSVSGLPPRSKASFEPTSTSTESTLTITTTSRTKTGTRTLTIAGTSGTLNSTTSVQLTVQ